MENEFYNKAKEYAIGRPTYPEEILNIIKELGMGEQLTIADIGAGTGLLTHMLCRLGCRVLAVEPNFEMLNECRKYCSTNTNIEYINAPAEKTQLKEHSIEIITIAQAFHWFDKQLCKAEFKRILKENGYVITIWNDMQEESDFTKEYMNIIHKYEIRTTAGNSHFNPDKEKSNFFGQDYIKIYYDNWQTATEEMVICKALSLSYTPSKSDGDYDKFVQELNKLFSKYQQNGKVTFHYKTEVCICQFLK
ncbi:class I SAM-dependent methyltransferase [Clostridium chromiireducens]|uniref:Class I SAM-dependent methyltransferase n=1 Tax=Clostridium chromiireducens TaxID=225345 RepID=A0A399IR16_9CLOT|nr:class I SAM-dependent methyltransferase [Clostridium chromiireducens]RII35494.1 class I SAM-dependent methyltransferase [Clostridium chromiireducens]